MGTLAAEGSQVGCDRGGEESAEYEGRCCHRRLQCSTQIVSIPFLDEIVTKVGIDQAKRFVCSPASLFRECPLPHFPKILEHVFSLDFFEAPDYKFIQSVLKAAMVRPFGEGTKRARSRSRSVSRCSTGTSTMSTLGR